MNDSKVYIYGRHALEEALANLPRAVKKIFVSPDFDDGGLVALAKKNGIPVAVVSGNKPRSGQAEEPIIGLLAPENLIRSFKDFIDGLGITADTSLVLLDEIQDPHNFGAIIRSAAALGASGVLVPEHNQVPITGAVIKVSAGMAFRIPIVSIGNVNTAVRELKTRGFWIYGMDETATHSLPDEKFDAPAVFIMGNEASGIRQKTLELCDILLSIPMNKRCESMNVAASAAVTLYAWSLEHPGALS